MKPSAHLLMNRPFARAALLASLGLVSMAAQAEIYKIVGPDGKVTFSDKPPASAQVAPATTGRPEAAADALPAELQKAMSAYPVRLYSTADCKPCDTARAMLKGRGVPFTERTVTTQEDAEAFARVSDKNSFPTVTMGSQLLSGYNSAEWGQYLDAAGYPKNSMLPKSYQYAGATPLTPRTTVKPGAAQADTEKSEPAVTIEAPKGIRF